MLNFKKRSNEPKQPEPEPNYQEWDAETLLDVFPMCSCGKRSVVVLVPPGTNKPEPFCWSCDRALNSA